MKKFMRIGRVAVVLLLVIAVSLVCVILLKPIEAVPLDSYHSSWKLIRETNNEDADTKALVYNLTLAGDFDNKNSSAVASGGPYHIRSYAGSGAGTEFQSVGGAWMFAICGENFDDVDDTFDFNIVGWSRINGMLQTIAEGDGVLGTQAVIAYPDDGADAVGATCSETSVAYDHTAGTQEKYFTVTNEGFDGAAVGQMAYVTGTNITSGYYKVLVVTDTNNVSINVTASNDNTDSTVQINPAFWADTINLDETTKWPSVAVYNSGDNEVCFVLIDTTGLEWIQWIIYKATAGSGEAGNITVYGRPY